MFRFRAANSATNVDAVRASNMDDIEFFTYTSSSTLTNVPLSLAFRFTAKIDICAKIDSGDFVDYVTGEQVIQFAWNKATDIKVYPVSCQVAGVQ